MVQTQLYLKQNVALAFLVAGFLTANEVLGQGTILNYRQCPALTTQKTMDGFPVSTTGACFDTMGWDYCYRVNIQKRSTERVDAFCGRWPIGQAGCCFSCNERDLLEELPSYSDLKDCEDNIPKAACEERFAAYCTPTNCNQVIYIYANCRKTCHKLNPAFGWCSPSGRGRRPPKGTKSPKDVTLPTDATFPTGGTETTVEYTGTTPTAPAAGTESTVTMATGTTGSPTGPSLTNAQAIALQRAFAALPADVRLAFYVASIRPTLNDQVTYLLTQLSSTRASPGDPAIIAFSRAVNDVATAINPGVVQFMDPMVYNGPAPPTAVAHEATLTGLGDNANTLKDALAMITNS